MATPYSSVVSELPTPGSIDDGMTVSSGWCHGGGCARTQAVAPSPSRVTATATAAPASRWRRSQGVTPAVSSRSPHVVPGSSPRTLARLVDRARALDDRAEVVEVEAPVAVHPRTMARGGHPAPVSASAVWTGQPRSTPRSMTSSSSTPRHGHDRAPSVTVTESRGGAGVLAHVYRQTTSTGPGSVRHRPRGEHGRQSDVAGDVDRAHLARREPDVDCDPHLPHVGRAAEGLHHGSAHGSYVDARCSRADGVERALHGGRLLGVEREGDLGLALPVGRGRVQGQAGDHRDDPTFATLRHAHQGRARVVAARDGQQHLGLRAEARGDGDAVRLAYPYTAFVLVACLGPRHQVQRCVVGKDETEAHRAACGIGACGEAVDRHALLHRAGPAGAPYRRSHVVVARGRERKGAADGAPPGVGALDGERVLRVGGGGARARAVDRRRDGPGREPTVGSP